MCQLLGMNANTPTDVMFSFTGFATRAEEHKDGFGIAFFEDKGVRLFVDSHERARVAGGRDGAPLPDQEPRTSSPTSARRPRAAVALENTHPFVRELWGRYWVFAHNGDLKGYAPRLHGAFRPVGATDSERAFCWLMQELAKAHASVPGDRRAERHAGRAAAAGRARTASSTPCSSNGQALWAHCSTQLHHIVRQHPFARASLQDDDVTRRLRRAHLAARPGGGGRDRAADPRRDLERRSRRARSGSSSTALPSVHPLRLRQHARAMTQTRCPAHPPLRHLLPARRADPAALRLRRGAPDAGRGARRSARATRAATSGSRPSPTSPPARAADKPAFWADGNIHAAELTALDRGAVLPARSCVTQYGSDARHHAPARHPRDLPVPAPQPRRRRARAGRPAAPHPLVDAAATRSTRRRSTA